MEYAYATLLLNESGEELNETNLVDVLKAAGVAVEESRVKAIVAALEGVEIEGASAAALADGDGSPAEGGGGSAVDGGGSPSIAGGADPPIEGGSDQPTAGDPDPIDPRDDRPEAEAPSSGGESDSER